MLGYGLTHKIHWDQLFNQEIATASLVSHNEAISGSVKVENCIAFLKGLGQTYLYSNYF